MGARECVTEGRQGGKPTGKWKAKPRSPGSVATKVPWEQKSHRKEPFTPPATSAFGEGILRPHKPKLPRYGLIVARSF